MSAHDERVTIAIEPLAGAEPDEFTVTFRPAEREPVTGAEFDLIADRPLTLPHTLDLLRVLLPASRP